MMNIRIVTYLLQFLEDIEAEQERLPAGHIGGVI